MADSTADVFVSYKAEDRARLKPLVSALEAEGFSVWWDAHIGGGVDWREDIQEHLDAAKCVIVAWSKRSVGQDGRFVRDEATRAQRRGVYLPLRLDEVEPPLGFGEVQALSLKGWKGDRGDRRFQDVAHAVRSRISGEHIAHRSTPVVGTRVSRRAVIAGGATCAVALTGAGAWMLLQPASANAKRIAVLPFANLSGDEKQAYFSEGVAEELRAALSRIGLEVIGRASSDAVSSLDTKAAASKLGVSNILTGSVRRSPETIRVNAQLVSGSDGVERWTQSYDRAPGDAIQIQSDIATNVAQALSIALGQSARTALSLGSTTDSVAQDLLLQSRNVTREADGPSVWRKAVALVDAALARDPNYADAYVDKANLLAGFAGNYSASPADAAAENAQAEAAAQQARRISPKLGSAYTALGGIELNKIHFKTMLTYLKQALAVAPDDLNILGYACRPIAYMGGGPKGLRLCNRFIGLDPFNGRGYQRRAEILASMRHFSEAIEEGRKALALAPNLYNARFIMGNGLLLSGRAAEAMAEYRTMPADDVFRLTGEVIAAARMRDFAGAERTMRRMKQLFGPSSSYQYGEIQAQLGNVNGAFAELENAIEASDSGLLYLKTDAFLDPIRGDPRYNTLLRRLQFPS